MDHKPSPPEARPLSQLQQENKDLQGELLMLTAVLHRTRAELRELQKALLYKEQCIVELEAALKRTVEGRKVLAASSEEPGKWIEPEGDQRCGVAKDACKCMKREGHEGNHRCVHGEWLAASSEEPGQ